ncbi:MAG: hypothetical protein FJ115_01225 [Deltaproteobacteria bacterium]|nr:hypothetical protein [Deltaproteobacteria bacterium]MBM4322154.1 hypothetical protein [Deltaproteobacteria bacterium]
MLIEPSRIPTFDELLNFFQVFPIDLKKVYPTSFCSQSELFFGLIRIGDSKKLAIIGDKEALLKDPFTGNIFNHVPSLKLCDLSLGNTLILMELFPFTKPVSLLNYPATIGTGDRLGMATPGHIRAVRKFKARPVFAQQSIRENGQTNRNFKEVIADAAWSVFQENYRKGYGADGDHLKSLDEVKLALDAGVSMITLDLSEKLNFEALSIRNEMVERRFREEIDPGDAKVLLHLLLDKEFTFRDTSGELSIRFSEEEVKRDVLLFHKAIDFSEEVYQFIMKRTGRKNLIDFEISADEIPFPTPPETHLFLMIVLRHRGVRFESLAPRFIGEFQKGIDYRGEVQAFRKQFYHHSLIAQHYGNYKLSIHSGSDKFSIFPHVGEIAGGKVHLKTAGTSWLEAVRLIALKSPSLFKEMYRTALSAFKEASKLYHVTTDLNRVPKPENLDDQHLSELLDEENSRQLLHITYGFLLNSPSRGLFFKTLIEHEEGYWSLLENHIEKHLNLLGVERGDDLCEV